ncbi:MAG: hypothetical protein ACREV4_03125 [Gammaproteobacteria bacterium]
MITIFSRINKELASWIAIWRFLRGLDCYGWNFYRDIDGPADASKNAEIMKREWKTSSPVMVTALANKARSNSIHRVMELAAHKPP